MQSKVVNSMALFLVYLGLAFPLFYFVYKFGNPEPVAHDFFQYYRLYLNWDVSNVIAPLNMRLVGAFFVHLFYQLNFYYDTETAFDMYRGWGFLEQVYFNAVLVNWLCVAFTSVVIFSILRQQGLNTLFSFNGGVLYLLGFGTIFYEMMPLTDACSVLLFSWAYRQYLKKSWWILLPLALFVLQREYVLLAMLLITIIDWVRFRRSYFAWTALATLVLALAHVLLRQTLFHNTPLAFQVDPAFLLHNLFHPALNPLEYIKQQALTLNLFWIYTGIVLYKLAKSMVINKYELLKILLLLLQVNLVSFAGALGTNVGRYFYLLVPVVIIQIIAEAAPLFEARHPVREQP